MELTEQLKADGIAKGLCEEWQSKLKPTATMKRLCNLYVRGIDFCISKDFPTLDFLREHFKGHCEPYNVFIDDVVSKTFANPFTPPDERRIVLNGDCKAFLEFEGYTVCQAYIRHNSQASVNVSNSARVTIDLFDNATIALAVSGNAQVTVNLYGNSSCEQVGGLCDNVTIRQTNKQTY